MTTRIAALRISIGSSALVTTGLATVLFGVPATHDNASSRALGRLFGIRNIVLGAWILGVRDADVEARRLCYKLNAVVDAVDVRIFLLPLARRQGIARFSLSTLTLAVAATMAWLDLLGSRVRPRRPVSERLPAQLSVAFGVPRARPPPRPSWRGPRPKDRRGGSPLAPALWRGRRRPA